MQNKDELPPSAFLYNLIQIVIMCLMHPIFAGVICVEGGTQNVDEFWYRIRRLNWKRIMIKEQEVKELEGREVDSLCKFSKFQELELEVQGGKGRSYHMDLGKFYEFLQEHDSAYIFPLYFGVEGKSVGV